MRVVREVFLFELHYQLRSPFFRGALLLFALIHFLTITGTGIHLDVSTLIDINSPYAILQTELVLFIFGMLPVVAFVATAMTRDFECATAPLVFVAPITVPQLLIGRFLGVVTVALLIGLAGLIGTLLGTFMPWLDQERIAPFSIVPWIYCYFVIIAPGMLVLCAIFFSVAALTRSVALTYAAAIVFFVADLLLNLYVNLANSAWLALADPTGALAVAEEVRYWSVAELGAQFPAGLLPVNRLLWLTVALLVLLVTLQRFRLELSEPSHLRLLPLARRRDSGTHTRQPPVKNLSPAQDFSSRANFKQFISQLRMDIGSICKSPLLYIILLLAVITVVGEFQRNVSPLLDTPLYPLTSLMVGFLRFGMMQYVLLIGLYYAAELVHRERESGAGEIIHASPFPDWLMILAKIVTLGALISVLLLAVIITSILLQAFSGHDDFQLGIYLQAAFLYNAFYYWMLCILAVFIQVVVVNKWLGMAVTLSAYIALMALPGLGYDHVLYGFSIPPAVYSDMNGFGHFKLPVLSLIAYWGAFCVLLVIAGQLLYPRGMHSSLRERLRDAGTRVTPATTAVTAFAAAAFLGTGGWIFYNTNVLNHYQSSQERLQQQADYEIAYGHHENAPTPSYNSIDMAIDIFPAERRLESRGTALLGNHKNVSVSEFVVSINPILQVNAIAVANATLMQSDAPQGFYLFRLDEPLAPGAEVKMTWDLTRSNKGFVASSPDNELVANGTFVNTFSILPIPGYDTTRRISDIGVRREFGLPPAPRLPELGDPAHLDSLPLGIDSRTDFQIVLSTSADQIAVAPGALQNEWQEGERRYFHYRADQPILPGIAIASARYAVSRDRWNDVALEIYYHPRHDKNIDAMMATAKQTLEFMSKEFAPYQYEYLRILEYPRYRTAAQAYPGTVPYSEAIGFIVDLSSWANVDYATIHELAHMWWGDRISGANMQGRQMLNETMAQYSTLMLFRHYYPPVHADRIAAQLLDSYLNARSRENEAEQPLMYTEEQGYISYNKGPLALYALQDIIGRDKVHQGLRDFMAAFSFQTNPLPTSRDLVAALRNVAGEEYQALITDLFEKIVLYELQIDQVTVREVDGEYEVAVTITAQQFEANERGEEIAVPLDTWFDVALFSDAETRLEGVTPLHIEKLRLRSGQQLVTLRTNQMPRLVALDPFHKMIERNSANNRKAITPD